MAVIGLVVAMAVGGSGGGSERASLPSILSGLPEPVTTRIISIGSTSLETASKAITVVVPEGAAPIGAVLSIKPIIRDALPPLPERLASTSRSVEVSLVTGDGEDAQLQGELMVNVMFDDAEVALANGDSSKLVIGHFIERLGQ